MNNIRPVFLTLAFTASMLLSASIAITPATAASIQYSFTGNVNHVHSLLSSEFNTSQSMSGSMTVDNGDTNSNTSIGNYPIIPVITNFSLNIGGYTATMGTSGQVEIRNGLPGLDRLNVTVNAPNGSNVNFLAPRLFDIQLRAPGGGSGSVFNSDALPTTVPSISSFSNFNRWRLIFGPDGDGKVVRGEIISLTAVPLPAAVILFGAGLVALVGLGAGSWRQKKNTIA